MIIAILTLIAGFSSPASGDKYAFLIGISNYDYGGTKNGVLNLKFPGDDVRSLEISLSNKEYKVIKLIDINAKREQIMTYFMYLRETLKKSDEFVLFFAGHGLRDKTNSQTYWLTYDTKLENLDHNGIRLQHLIDYVNDIKAEKKLILLDHCFSGDIGYDYKKITLSGPRSSDFTEPKINRGVLPLDEFNAINEGSEKGVVILAAARDEAYEHQKYGNGIFTEALIKAFESREADTHPDGMLSINELVQFMSNKVPVLSKEVGTKQKPISLIKAINPEDWFILKLPKIRQLTERVCEKYKDKILDWATREEPLIDIRIQVLAYASLNELMRCIKENQELGSDNQKAINTIKEMMYLLEDPEYPEEEVAEILNDKLKKIYEKRLE